MIGQEKPAPYAKGQYFVICENGEHYHEVLDSLAQFEVEGQKLNPRIAPFKSQNIIGLTFPNPQELSSELEQKILKQLAEIPYVASVEHVANMRAAVGTNKGKEE